MSNYSKTTDFAAKDALLTGDPNKIVKGTEINDEFDAIQTAVNSKANNNNTALTGIPTAPTATFGTETTQIATTAFVQAALAALHPVGSVYINANTATNPATLLGFGTWSAFGAGRVMVGIDAGDASFDTAGETGGSKDAIVVSHTHTASVTDPGHIHTTLGYGSGNSATYGNGGGVVQTSNSTASATTGVTVSVNSTGSSGTNANLQPYVVVYMWKRTA
jgi:hypothetical protein